MTRRSTSTAPAISTGAYTTSVDATAQYLLAQNNILESRSPSKPVRLKSRLSLRTYACARARPTARCKTELRIPTSVRPWRTMVRWSCRWNHSGHSSTKDHRRWSSCSSNSASACSASPSFGERYLLARGMTAKRRGLRPFRARDDQRLQSSERTCGADRVLAGGRAGCGAPPDRRGGGAGRGACAKALRRRRERHRAHPTWRRCAGPAERDGRPRPPTHTLVHEVVVTVRAREASAEMERLWKGGARSRLRVPLARRGPERHRTSEETVELVPPACRQHPTARSLRSSTSGAAHRHRVFAFTEARVRGLRQRAGIAAAPPPDPAGELVTLDKAAAELGVSTATHPPLAQGRPAIWRAGDRARALADPALGRGPPAIPAGGARGLCRA
jgi:hypothetical protein